MKITPPKSVFFLSLAILALSLSYPISAKAQAIYAGTLLYNTNQPAFGSFPSVFAGQWLAAPFRTGADSAQLDSVTIAERTFLADGSFWVSIYSDNNGLPGTVLSGGELSGPSMPQGWAFQTYSATQVLTLAPSTLYWIVAASDGLAQSGGAYGWAWAQNDNYASPVNWTSFNYEAFSSDQGGTWTSTSGPLMFAVNGVVVPEPSAMDLALLGSMILLYCSCFHGSNAFDSFFSRFRWWRSFSHPD